MKALVTGASGFIGSHLVQALLRRGWAVRCLVRPTSRLKWLEGLELELVTGDVRDKASLPPAVQDVDLVFHLGAIIHARDWETSYAVNTLGTQNLLEACEGAAPNLKKFVFVSSVSASGPSPRGHAKTEDEPCEPISSYGKSKLMAEGIVRAHGARLPFVILRPPNVLGPREREMVTILSVLQKGIKPRLGRNEPQTSFIMVQDLVEAIILCAESKRAEGQVYNITDGRAYSWLETVDTLGRLLGRRRYLTIPYGLIYFVAGVTEALSRLTVKRPMIKRSALRSLHDFCWIYDSSKIGRELGFKPRVTLEQGLAEIVDWYRTDR